MNENEIEKTRILKKHYSQIGQIHTKIVDIAYDISDGASQFSKDLHKKLIDVLIFIKKLEDIGEIR